MKLVTMDLSNYAVGQEPSNRITKYTILARLWSKAETLLSKGSGYT